MSFDQDPNEQANISGADLAILADELKQLRAQLTAEQVKSEKLAGQVAMLVEALDRARNGIVWYSENSDDADDSDTEMLCEIDAVLAATAYEADVEAYLAEGDAKVLEDFADELEQKLKTSEFIPVVKAQTTIFIGGLRMRAAECRKKGANNEHSET